MSIFSRRRRGTLAGFGLGAALIAAAAGCNAAADVAPKVPTLILLGTWQYNGLQPVGFGSAFIGLVAIDSLADGNFTGAFEGQIADSLGVRTQATAVITGQQTDSISIRFSFVTPDGDTIVNTGFLDVDTLRGEWLNRRAVAAGSFTMVREGKADDPNAPRGQSLRPRRP